jgi:hypothetical protein
MPDGLIRECLHALIQQPQDAVEHAGDGRDGEL